MKVLYISKKYIEYEIFEIYKRVFNIKNESSSYVHPTTGLKNNEDIDDQKTDDNKSDEDEKKDEEL